MGCTINYIDRELSSDNANQADNAVERMQIGSGDNAKILPNLFAGYFGNRCEVSRSPPAMTPPAITRYQQWIDDIIGYNDHTTIISYSPFNVIDDTRNDKLQSLPNDILQYICRHLKFEDLINMELCNQRLFSIARNKNSNCEFDMKYSIYLNNFCRFKAIEQLVINPEHYNPNIGRMTSDLSNLQKKRLQFSDWHLVLYIFFHATLY